MKVLLLSGLGPYFKSTDDLDGSLFHSAERAQTGPGVGVAGAGDFDLGTLTFVDRHGAVVPLLRPEQSGSLSLEVDGLESERAPVPHLTTFTLQSILRHCDADFDDLSLEAVWQGTTDAPASDYDVVFLSTTFICDRRSLARAVRWSATRCPGVPVVVGGQFSNLKYEEILRAHEGVLAVVRGDGERAIPLLLRALSGRGDFDDVPNLAMRSPNGSGITVGDLEYVDLEHEPAPTFPGRTGIVPYESMRGCPYSCKFCSFPAASPKWRYKSARKIVDDWSRYRDENGAAYIRALDSTFTVPPARFHELLGLLPSLGIGWEAFTRANSIHSAEIVEQLAAAGCRTLSIGFESMSDASLDYMNKKVSAKQNRRAFELLAGGPVGYRMSFMVGYPGETPEDYEETHRFLVEEYSGHFQLYVFSLQDETMPVWDDFERFDISVADPLNVDYSWSHSGMDVQTAQRLRADTLRAVRWSSDDAVSLLWQPMYQTPLIPGRSARENYRIEKAVERVGMSTIDFSDPADRRRVQDEGVAQLGQMGVQVGEFDQPAVVG